MPAATTISILGLEELQETLSAKKLTKNVAVGLGLGAKNLHSGIISSIKSRYNIPESAINNAWTNKGRTAKTIGENLVNLNMEYSGISRDLSKFPYSVYAGNINSNATRQGRVHKVAIKKGAEKIVHGKYRFGGFVPYSPLKGVWRGPKGATMFERTSVKAYPITPVFAPTIATMVRWALDYSPRVKEELNKLESFILEHIWD